VPTKNIPLIISGAPRSGTTLLYNLFDGHSQIGWLVEEGFLFEFFDRLDIRNASVVLDAIPADTDALIAGLRSRQLMPPLNEPVVQSPERGSVTEITIDTPWSEEKFRAALASPRGGGVEGLWQRLAGAYLAAMGQEPRLFACMKAPDFCRSVHAVLELVPDARAITILRNPLYALDSLKRSREMRGAKLFTWPEFAQNVIAFLEMQKRIGQADRKRHRVVKYETLVEEPGRTMRDVAEWLGITFEPCLLEPTVLGKSWPGISSFQPMSGIERSSAERGIKSLTAGEQQFVRKTLARLLAEYGYE